MSKCGILFRKFNLNINTLNKLLDYFDYSDKNTIIELITNNDKVIKNVSKYKDNIIDIVNHKSHKSIFMSGIEYKKIIGFISENMIYYIYLYKTNNKNIKLYNHKLIKNINHDDADVIVYLELTNISVYYNKDKYNSIELKNDLKVYSKTFRDYFIYILIFLIFLIGVYIFIKR